MKVDVRVFNAGVTTEDDETSDGNEYECYCFQEADKVDELFEGCQ